MHVIEHRVHGARDRIGHVLAHAVGIEAELLLHGLAAFRVDRRLLRHIRLGALDDLAGNADDGGTGRHFTRDHGIGADLGAGTDGERAENLGAGTDDDTIAEGRVALAGVPGGAAEGDAVIEGHVIADQGGLADHDAHAVVDEEAATDGGTRVDLDAGQPAHQGRAGARQPFGVVAP